MDPPRERGLPEATALSLLNYLNVPVVGLYFSFASIYGAIFLQRSKALPKKRQRFATALMAGILTSFLAEVMYYFTKSLAERDYHAPQSAAINCLGSILLWGSLTVVIAKADKIRWQPYFGTFALECGFQTTLSVLSGVAMVPDLRSRDVALSLGAFRAVFSFLLVIDWLSIRLGRGCENGTDEEARALLGNRANGTANGTAVGTANGTPKSNAGYGATNQEGSDSEEDEEIVDHDKDIKEKQAKRLEEEGGWVGYLKAFGIFLPYLWPKNDHVVLFCLLLRGIHVIQTRIFNVLAPRQLGIITDKLANGATVMPWTDIALWTFYSYITGYSGFGMIDSIANMVITDKSSARISLMAYKHVMNLSMDFHTDKSTGEVLKAVEQASALNTLVDMALFEVLPVLIDVVISLWYVTHLFDPYMGFIVLFMGTLYAWFGVYFTTWNRGRRRVYTERQRTENQVVNETLHNWHTVFYFNRAPYEQQRYANATWSTIKAHYRYFFGSIAGHSFQDILMTMGFTGCCIFAISQIISGAKPVGNLVTFVMYWNTMMNPLYMISWSWRTLTNSLIDAERLLQLLQTKPTVNDTEGAKPIVVKDAKVEFKDVCFAYDPRKQIIKNVNLTAEGGHTVAFVGETGGGKSTMLKLLSRAYDVTGGSISIDGQDIRSVTRSSLRDIMGLVPQDPELFNTTIRENIRYGRLEATDAEIEDACRAAAIHDTIVDFPDGYNSKVGERGVKLSGGQLQRIAIARVLLRNPKIVLLDEATSAVDSAIEALIQEAFRKLSAGRTTFVIAHRLSTIVEADQILVVDKGEIIERGTHTGLLEAGGKYAELWSKQTAGHSSNVHSITGSKANSEEGDDVGAQFLIDITPPEVTATGRDDEGTQGEARKR